MRGLFNTDMGVDLEPLAQAFRAPEVPMLLGISILIEVLVAVVAFAAARKGRAHLYGLSFTFGVYVLYDLNRMAGSPVTGPVLSGLFLLASLGALVAVIGLWREPRAR